jgi:RNA polymerase sigma-70 factor (ECF subfamily)
MSTSISRVMDDHRGHLFGIAYRMLGSAADADDALQETFLRWHTAVDRGTRIESDRAWLTTAITRICLDQLRSARVKRETYVGPWLPEPLVEGAAPDVAESAVLAESLSTAFLLLLERLSPKERAVFLLHDVFNYDFATIAGIIGESEVNCRQIARRARGHVTEDRPRFPTPPERQQELLDQFVAAYTDGDLPGLINILADDVTLWADGGGRVTAAVRPILGQDKVYRFLSHIADILPATTRVERKTINGGLGILVADGDRPISLISFDFKDDRIHAIFVVVNPEKLPPTTPLPA